MVIEIVWSFLHKNISDDSYHSAGLNDNEALCCHVNGNEGRDKVSCIATHYI